MMTHLAAVIGGLGLICLISRKTLVGVLIGGQLLVLGASMMFVLCSAGSELAPHGHAFGLLIVFGGIAQLAAGYALVVRVFYLKKRIDMSEMTELRR